MPIAPRCSLLPTVLLLGVCVPAVLAQERSGIVSTGAGAEERARVDTVAAEAQTMARFTGRVVDAGGRPLSDAVVLTSAGGRAVTDVAGDFALALELPAAVERLHVTAVATVPGAGTLSGSVGVSVSALAAAVSLGDIALSAVADCTPEWLPTFGQPVGLDGTAMALAVFDDGGGEALYVGGGFTTAGGVTVERLAKWDGRSWSAVGGGIAGSFPRVEALAVFDDGSGAALYAGGSFDTAGGVPASNIARWDGTSWSALGTGVDGTVEALVVHDDRTGTALYAGGSFHDAGGATAHEIAKWDGTSWSPLGLGMGADIWGVEALAVFDDGSGQALYAGGSFLTAGGTPAKSVAKWSGTFDGSSWSFQWTPLGAGLTGAVKALAVYDDGTGEALYVGGTYQAAVPTTKLARWDGAAWSMLAAGSGDIASLLVHDDGSGEALFAGGNFATIDGVAADSIAKWDGTSWSEPDGGMPGLNDEVWALAAFDDGRGARLFATGRFATAGSVTVDQVARWDGTSWRGLGSGMDATVQALAVHDDGSGPALYAGGEFTESGGAQVDRVAKWDGTTWSALGSGMNGSVLALAVYVQGGDEVLCAGGAFSAAGGVPASHVASWDGASWSALGGGMTVGASTDVRSLAVYDDGGGEALYAGGQFTAADGLPASRIARWDGTSWSALGSGLNSAAEALVVHDDGAGPALYVGGQFTTAGGVTVNRVARWNGTSWMALGGGMTGAGTPFVNALAVYDTGTGAALYAGGGFTTAGGMTVNRVAQWNGTSWSALGTGVTGGPVRALAVFDDGAGPALYAGGDFTTAGGGAANRVARWNGSTWSALGSGISASGSSVQVLATHDDGSGAGLIAGGAFLTAGGNAASHIAKWDFCAFPPPLSPWSNVGGGKPGTGGLTPLLAGTGPLTGGSSNSLALSQAVPSTSAHLIVGLSALNAPFKGGTLVPFPMLIIYALPVGGAGTFTLPFTWPMGVPAGLPFWSQVWVVDAGAMAGLSASNGLRGEAH